MTKPSPAETGLPAWFDASLHHAGTGGIFETATGTVLDEDGAPQSIAARMARAETPDAKPGKSSPDTGAAKPPAAEKE